jgi:uncharacterized membrane protein (DUF485 family)
MRIDWQEVKQALVLFTVYAVLMIVIAFAVPFLSGYEWK